MSDRRTAFANAIDATDIPIVPATALNLAVAAMVDTGHGLSIINGASQSAREQIEIAFWQNFDGDRSIGITALIRFWQLVDTMSARRLKAMFLDRGYAALAPLAAAAATLRLNMIWGFKPQHLVATLLAADNKVVALPASRLAA